MDLFELLKQLKKIEPNADYTRWSRMVILSTRRESGEKTLEAFLTRFRLARSLVLAGAGILAIFFMWGLVGSGPSSLPGLDPVGLRAEAEAIDIQIKLTGLVYENSDLVNKTTTTAAVVLDPKSNPITILDSESQEIQDLEVELEASDSSESQVGINQILELISE